MVKWLGVLLPAVLAVVAALSDVIQPFIAANPTLATLIAAVGAIIAVLSRSPVQKQMGLDATLIIVVYLTILWGVVAWVVWRGKR